MNFLRLVNQAGFTFLILVMPRLFGVEPRNNPEARYHSLQEYFNRHSLVSPESRPTIENPISKSDLGLQRPIETKKHGFGYYFGFESRFLYSNNPTSLDSSPVQKGGIWENSINNNFILGAYDLAGATFSPMLGIGINQSTHFGHEDLGVLDTSTLRLSFNGIFQFTNGWSLRAGIGNSSDFDSDMTLSYQQTSPSLAISKTFSQGPFSTFLDISLSYHFTDASFLDMDRLESAFLWGFQISFKHFEISPYLRFAYGNYTNQNRHEFTANTGMELSYRFYDWLLAKLLFTYSNRNANGINNDFSRLDSGGAISLQANF